MSRDLKAAYLLVLGTLTASCGGGGSSGAGSADNLGNGGPFNRPPIVVKPNTDQYPLLGGNFEYDATQGGTTFVDPDGDELRYELVVVGEPPPDLAASDTTFWAQPTQPWLRQFIIRADDQRGGIAADTFVVAVNRAPELVLPAGFQFVDIGIPVDFDVTQDGFAFVDADGDPLSYDIELLSAPRGLATQGTHIVGRFDAFGLVRFRTRGSDPFGGSVEDEFAIVAPAPIADFPVLPDPPYVYDDLKLDLPYLFRVSREITIPFWDTTPSDNPTTDAGAMLGRVLFYDKRLSVTNTAACGSCHEQEHGFARPERFSAGFQGDLTHRNVMALGNVRYNIIDHYFSDGRAAILEALVPMPIEDPTELGHSMPLLAEKLSAVDYYPPLFAAAFGTADVTPDRIVKALAQFLRSMINYRSRFDQAFHVQNLNDVADPAAVLTPQELRGVQLFRELNCSHCHFNDVHAASNLENNGIDAIPTDPGAGGGHFRAASLRNIAVTAPYMHDGRFEALRQVIEHYDHEVQASIFLSPQLRTNLDDPRRPNMSEDDKDALEAYLNTLTDHEFLTDPKFSDPFR